MAALEPALQGAKVSGAWTSNAVNVPITAGPLSPTSGYPGAIQSNHADTGKLPANVAGPVTGDQAPDVFEDTSVYWAQGGYVTSPELTYEGHNSPFPAGTSNHGHQFAGSGPVTGLHGRDDGGTFLNEHEGVPDIGRPWRNTPHNQSYDFGVAYDAQGRKTNFAGTRSALDQYTGNHMVPMNEHMIPYGERPIYLNIANVAQPMTTHGGTYTPSGGALEDRANNQPDVSVIYETPPDPQAVTTGGIQAQYVPGSEFV